MTKKDDGWFSIGSRLPAKKDSIVVKLNKMVYSYTHAYIYVRNILGLNEWFDKWRYASPQEAQEFGKTDCAYLKEDDKDKLE